MFSVLSAVMTSHFQELHACEIGVNFLFDNLDVYTNLVELVMSIIESVMKACVKSQSRNDVHSLDLEFFLLNQRKSMFLSD